MPISSLTLPTPISLRSSASRSVTRLRRSASTARHAIRRPDAARRLFSAADFDLAEVAADAPNWLVELTERND